MQSELQKLTSFRSFWSQIADFTAHHPTPSSVSPGGELRTTASRTLHAPIRSKSFGNSSVFQQSAARERQIVLPDRLACMKNRRQGSHPQEKTTDLRGKPACRAFSRVLSQRTAWRARKIALWCKLSCDICATQPKHVVDCLQQKGRWSTQLGSVPVGQDGCDKTPEQAQKRNREGAAWFSAN